MREIALAVDLRIYEDGDVVDKFHYELREPTNGWLRRDGTLDDEFEQEVQTLPESRIIVLRTVAEGIHDDPLATVTVADFPEELKINTRGLLLLVGNYGDKLKLQKMLTEQVAWELRVIAKGERRKPVCRVIEGRAVWT